MKYLSSNFKYIKSNQTFLLVAVLMLSQCSGPPKMDDANSTPPYLENEKDNKDTSKGNRSEDEKAIGGQKLGETFVSKAAEDPDGAAVAAGSGDPAKPAQAPGPNGAPPPPPPAPPKLTHVTSLTCGVLMDIRFTFDGQKIGASVTSPSKCAQLAAALNGVAFPTGKTTAKPTGGPTIKSRCTAGSLTLDVREVNGQSQTSIVQSFNLESEPVCLEIRNVINGLNL